MGLLKKILKRRRDLKLIISSATVDAEYIRDFFNRGKETSKTGTATILSVEGKMRGFSVTISDHGVLRSKLQRRHFLPELSMCGLCEGLCWHGHQDTREGTAGRRLDIPHWDGGGRSLLKPPQELLRHRQRQQARWGPDSDVHTDRVTMMLLKVSRCGYPRCMELLLQPSSSRR